MKKCFLAVLVLVFFTACGGNGDYAPEEDVSPPGSAIIGRWEGVDMFSAHGGGANSFHRFEDYGLIVLREFREDGTGLYFEQHGDGTTIWYAETTYFTWTAASGIIDLTFIDPPPHVYPHATFAYSVDALNTTLTTTMEFFWDGDYVTNITTFRRMD